MIDLDQGGATHGSRELLRPPGDLVPLIEYGWIERRNAPAAATERAWRIVPDVSAHLIYSRTRAGGRLRLVGSRSRWTDIDVSARSVTLGVRFRPGAIAGWLRFDAKELTDRSLAFESVTADPNLTHRLEDASSDARRLSLLFDSLRGWSSGTLADWRTRAALAMAHDGRTGVADISRSTGVSPRTLHAVMQRDVGLGPKHAARIVRIGRALRAAAVRSRPDWRAIAAEIGFADQAHLIRDCRALVGESPARFLARGR